MPRIKAVASAVPPTRVDQELATVFYVLERYLEDHGFGKGGRDLISALGPGFCSESLLVGL